MNKFGQLSVEIDIRKNSTDSNDYNCDSPNKSNQASFLSLSPVSAVEMPL